MARLSASKNWRFTLLALVTAGVVWWAQQKGWLPDDQRDNENRRQPEVTTTKSKPRSQPKLPGGQLPRGREGEMREIGEWQEWRGCELVEERSNDGDSFVVRHGSTDTVIRLYFADCPEKYRHQHNGERIAEQGRYFGGLTEEETVGIGEAARDFSLGRLRGGNFTVLTKGEAVYDSGRVYAFVMLSEGDLAELLVQAGLARIHTGGANRPEGATAKDAKRALEKLEREAKSVGRGAWGLRRKR